MSTSDEESIPKRRRIASAEEEDDENDGDVNTDNGSPLSSRGGRVARLEELAAQRRKQRRQERRARELQQEVEDIRLVGDNTTEENNFYSVENDNDSYDDGTGVDEDYEEDGDGDVDAYVTDPNLDAVLEEEEDGEDLMDNMERDYQRIAALDTYGAEGLDNREYDEMDIDARRAAEEEIARRQKAGARNDSFYGMLDADDAEEGEDARRLRRGPFHRSGDDQDMSNAEDQQGFESDEDLDGDDHINLEAFDVPLREWIAQERTRREIQRKFRSFLKHYVPDSNGNTQPENRQRRGNGVYELKIKTMCAYNQSTLQVSYLHLMDAEPVLAYWLADAPKDMLDVLNEAATRHTLMLFPSYTAIKSQIHVRVSDVPILDSLRDLRRSHLDCFVKIHGVVTRRSKVYPQLQLAYYTCLGCKRIQGPIRIQGVATGGSDNNVSSSFMPDSCPCAQGNAFFKLHPILSQYRNMQRFNLQETPGSVPPGRVPRTKEIILADDLIDAARPGEEIEVTGIYEQSFDSMLTIKSGFPVFSTYITANHIRKREDASSASNLSEEDVAKILELSRDPRIGERIVQSIAPSIFGHNNCKMALAMSLFSGVPKNINDKHRIRGDVNVLLLGDPGTAKSQLLKYAENTAPRAVYSTGKGASAVGLTASVQKDPITREWTLEGGALVLADRGCCLIDEFDKMNEQDRTSIHEAMEQQSISVSKAGIVTSLQARCSVIAAANPIGGRYDSSNTLSDNVELTDPILQRFDILCVLQDTVDPIADERLAMFVTGSHMRAVATKDIDNNNNNGATTAFATATTGDDHNNGLEMIPQDLLRKYIQYARTNVRPILRNNTFDQEKVASLYVALRRESAASGGVSIAVRHVESMMRMAEAHAKMHLRDYVRDDDMDASIKMMLQSFIMAQKFSVRRALNRAFAKFITSGEDRVHLLLHIVQDMFRKEQMYQVIRLRQKNLSEDLLDALDVPLDELESRARERKIYDLTEFLNSEPFKEAGYLLDMNRRVITRSNGITA